MAKQKTIPQPEAAKTENERKLSQLRHKKQRIENRITYSEKGNRRNRAVDALGMHRLPKGGEQELAANAKMSFTRRRGSNSVLLKVYIQRQEFRIFRNPCPL